MIVIRALWLLAGKLTCSIKSLPEGGGFAASRLKPDFLVMAYLRMEKRNSHEVATALSRGREPTVKFSDYP